MDVQPEKYVVKINGQERTVDKDKFEANIDKIAQQYPDATIRVYNKDSQAGQLPVSNYRKAVDKGGYTAVVSNTAISQKPQQTQEPVMSGWANSPDIQGPMRTLDSLKQVDAGKTPSKASPPKEKQIPSVPTETAMPSAIPNVLPKYMPNIPTKKLDNYIERLPERPLSEVYPQLTEEEAREFHAKVEESAKQAQASVREWIREGATIREGIADMGSYVHDLANNAYGNFNERQREYERQHPILAGLSNIRSARTHTMPDPRVQDTQVRNYSAAASLVDDAKKIVEQYDRNAAEGSNFVKNIGHGLRNGVFDISTWDMGLAEGFKNTGLLEAVKKEEAGKELTRDEQILLDAAALNLATEAYYGSDLGRGYTTGSVTAASIPFMLEFLASPLSGAGKGLSKSIVKYGLKRFGKSALKSGLGKTARVATRVAADTAAAGGMAATTGSIRVGADTAGRMAGNLQYQYNPETEKIEYAGRTGAESFGKALLKSYGAQTIEYFSEMMGDYFGPVGNMIGKSKVAKSLGKTQVGKVLNDISTSDWAKAVRAFEQQVQWHGTMGEYGEEVAGTVLNSIFIGDEKISDVVDLDKQIDTFLGVSLMGGAFSAIRSAGYRTPAYTAKRSMIRADAKASEIVGGDWNGIRERIDGSQNDTELVGTLAEIYQSDELNDAQKRAIYDYAGRRQQYEGVVTADNKAVDEGVKTPEQQTLEQSYIVGQESVEATPEEKQAIRQAMLDALYLFSDERLIELDAVEDQQAYISEHPEEAEILTAYFDAKARYDGLIDGTRTTIEETVDDAMSGIDQNTHPNGNIYSATMKDGMPVSIVSGDIMLDQDGQLDTKRSGSWVVIRREGAQPEMVDISEVAQIDGVENSATAKEITANTLYEQATAKAAQEIEGDQQALFENEDVVTLNVEGNPVQGIVIQSATPEGTILVQFDQPQDIPGIGEGQVLEFTPAQLQRLAGQPPIATAGSQDVGTEQSAPMQAEQPAEVQELAQPMGVVSDIPQEQAPQVTPETEQLSQQVTNEVIPTDKNGQPDYTAIESPQVYADALRQEFGNESTEVAAELLSEALGKLEKAQSKTNPIERRRAVRAAETEVQKFQSIAAIISPPTETSTMPIQKPIIEKTKVPTSQSRKKTAQKTSFQKEIDALGEPISIEDVILQDIARGKRFRWADDGVRRGLATELGFKEKEEERKARFNLLHNDGDTVDNYAERLYFEYGRGNEGIGQSWNLDDNDIRSIIIDILNNIVSKRQALEAAKAMRRNMEAEAAEYAEGAAENQRLLEEDASRDYYATDKSTPEEIDNLFSDNEQESLSLQQTDNYEFGLHHNELDAADGLAVEQERTGVSGDIVGPTAQDEAGQGQGDVSGGGKVGEAGGTGDYRDVRRRDSAVGGTEGASMGRDTSGYNRRLEETRPQETNNADGSISTDKASNGLGRLDTSPFTDRGGARELTPEEESIAEKINADIDENLASLRDEALRRRQEYEHEKSLIGQAYSEDNQQTLFERGTEIPEGALFSIPRDLSRQNIDAILEPIRAEIDRITGRIEEIENSRQKIVSTTIDAHRAQLRIAEAESDVNTEPTEAQKEAGNYRKGHTNVQGFDITIEQPKGSVRSGTDENGHPWSQVMNNTYGYFKRTQGKDGDHIDVFIGDNPNSRSIFVVDQINPDGTFDEHKVMLGFDSIDEARNAYLSNYEEGWQGLGTISAVESEDFRKWLDNGTRKGKPFADYVGIQKNTQAGQDGLRYRDGIDSFDNLTDEYTRLVENKDNNPNFEQEINEWRDRKVEVVRSLFERVASEYGITQTIVVFNGQTDNNILQEVALTVYPSVTKAEIDEFIEQWRADEWRGFGFVITGSNTLFFDISASDHYLSEERYVKVLIHETTHINARGILSAREFLEIHDEVQHIKTFGKIFEAAAYKDKSNAKKGEEAVAYTIDTMTLGKWNNVFQRFMDGEINAQEAVGRIPYEIPKTKTAIIRILNKFKNEQETNGREKSVREDEKTYDGLRGGRDGFKRTGRRTGSEQRPTEKNTRTSDRQGDSGRDIGGDGRSGRYGDLGAAVTETVRQTADSLNVPVRIVEAVEDIVTPDSALQERQRASRGWYDPGAGEIVVVIPNHPNPADAVATVLHEAVGHYGMRNLLGAQYDTFLDKVYTEAADDIRREIFRKSQQLQGREIGNIRLATEEYIAELAEQGIRDPFLGATVAWENIKSALKHMLRRMGIVIRISDNDLRYLLWKSYNRLQTGDSVMERARKIAADTELRREMQDAEPRYSERPDAENRRIIEEAKRQGTYMQAPNGQTTNLSPEQWATVRTQAFKEWFGDWENDPDNASKVVDENGEPMVVYHGSPDQFTIFDANKIGRNGTSNGQGFYFTNDPSYAESYMNEGGSLFKVFLNLRQPLDSEKLTVTRSDLRKILKTIDDLQKEDGISYFLSNYDDVETVGIQRVLAAAVDLEMNSSENDVELIGGLVNGSGSLNDVYMALRKTTRRDGIIAKQQDNSTHYVVGASNQIKSASDNTGAFNPDNPDIRFRGPANQPAVLSQAQQSYEESTARKAFKLTEAYQDSMLGLKRLQEAIVEESGKQLTDYENAYAAENQMSSKSTYETEFYRDNFFNPMIESVSALMGKGYSYEEVIQYVIAKSGLERNDVFAMRDAQRVMNERVKMMDAEVKHDLIDEEEYQQRLKEYEQQKELDYRENRQRDYSGLTQLVQNITGEEEVNVARAEAYAEELVEDIETQQKEETDALWSAINNATKETLRKSYESGMMTKANYTAVRDMFQYYVPMRGWQEDTAADVWDYMMTERSPFNAPVNSARGRQSVADDPLATIGNMGESAILQGNRNLMKQNFLNMAMNHPTRLLTVKGLWYENHGTASKPDFQASFPDIPENATPDEIADAINRHEELMKELEKEGRAQQGRAGLTLPYRALTPEKNEHIVTVKRGGKEYVIYVNGNPRAAQAVNGLTNEHAGNHKGLESIQRFNRQLAANFTTRNPAFVLSNMSRDMIFAGAAVFIKEDAKYNVRFLANLAGTTKNIWPMMYRYYQGKLDIENNQADKYFLEFLQNGGETGYTALHNVGEYKKLIDRKIVSAQGKVDVGRIFGFASGKATSRTAMPIVKGLQSMASGIGFMNRCAEDVSRFSTYMTSRQMGRSIQRSVADAKEITVNFNKKGAGGYGATTFKSLYLFFNAAVQSLANFQRLAKKNPRKFSAVIGGYIAAGAFIPMLNEFIISMFGGDDDKDAYNNLPDWARRNNFCFYLGDGKFLTIPIAIELRAFYGMGEMFYQSSAGNMRHRNVPMEIAGQFSDLLPLNVMGNNGEVFSGELKDIVNVVMPDAGKPIWQVVVNKDFFGKPVFKDTDYNKRMPGYTKAYRGTSQMLVSSAEFLNEISGGDKYSRGAIDVNPAVIEHIFENYFGGTAKTINQLGKTISMIWNEEQRVIRNVPVVSRFVSATDDRNAFSRVNEEYYNYFEEYRNTQQRVRGYENEIKTGDILKYAEKQAFLNNSPEYLRYEIFREYEKEINDLSKMIRDADTADERQMWEMQLNLTKTELVERLRAIEE